MMATCACGFSFSWACGGGKSKEAQVCERGNDLCSDDVNVRECADQLRGLKKMVGDGTYPQLLTCGARSKSCPEFLGCFVGSFAGMGKEFERGFKQTAGGSDDESDRGTHRDLDPRRDTDSDHHTDSAHQTDSDHRTESDHHADSWSTHTESHSSTTHNAGDDNPQTVTCAKFEGQPRDAKWNGCSDKVRREVVCEPFVDELRCACVADGVETWHFTARDPQLQDKDEATRVARANCAMGFDGF
jgi:hypothetical protein